MSKELEFTDIVEEDGQPSSSGQDLPHARRKQRERKDRWEGLLRVFIKLAVVAGTVFLLCRLVICPYPVHGNRMFPKLRDGDCAVVLKIGGFQKGDVVTFKKDGARYFARIVGTSGDHVAVSNTDYRINDLLQSEEVFYETVSNEPVDVIVGPDEVFLLNDYRSESSDSRTFGTLSLSEIDGKVVFLFRWRGI